MSEVPADNELARRTVSGPVACGEYRLARWRFDALPCCDRFLINLTLELPIRVGRGPGDLQTFAEALLATPPIAATDDLVAHVAPLIRPTLVDCFADSAAAALLERGLPEATSKAIETALRRHLFALGVDAATPRWSIDSPELRRQQAIDRADADAARRHQRQRERAEELAALRRDAGLENLSPADRGEYWLARLRESAAVPCVLAVGGTAWVRVTSDGSKASDLPPEIGPGRSIGAATLDGRPIVWLGGRDGAAIVGSDATPLIFRSPPHSAATGYNAVAIDESSGRIVASHSAVGVVIWPVYGGEPQRVVQLSELPAPPRSVIVNGGAALVACGSSLAIIADDLAIAAIGVPIVALVADGASTLVVTSDGAVRRFDASGLADVRGPARECIAADALEVDGLPLLALLTAAGRVELLDPLDGLAVHLHDFPAGSSTLAASAGGLAGVAPDRTGLLVAAHGQAARSLSLWPTLRSRVASIAIEKTAAFACKT